MPDPGLARYSVWAFCRRERFPENMRRLCRLRSQWRRNHSNPTSAIHSAMSAFFGSTVAAIARLLSRQSSIFVGSPSEPVVYTRTTLFAPAVFSFLPLGVYARQVGTKGSEKFSWLLVQIMVDKLTSWSSSDSLLCYGCHLYAGNLNLDTSRCKVLRFGEWLGKWREKTSGDASRA